MSGLDRKTVKKNWRSRLNNGVFWGVVGVLLTIGFGVVGLYTYFHGKKPNLQLDVISESNVLDLHKQLDDLTIYFHKEDIQKSNLNLRIINLQIINNGEADILQSYYDQKLIWGIKVSSGRIINNIRILSTNSEYLKNNLNPEVIENSTIALDKVIFEKGKFINIEILVLHSRDVYPGISFIGKIAGLDKIEIVKTWEKNLNYSFIDKFFYGGFLINSARMIIYFVFGVILLLAIAFTVETSSRMRDKAKEKRLKRKLNELIKNKVSEKNANLLIDNYIWGGLEKLKIWLSFLNNDSRLRIESKEHDLKRKVFQRKIFLARNGHS